MAKCPPILLTSPEDTGRQLARTEATPGGSTSEGWLQRLLYQHPELLPAEEFDETGPVIAIAREVPTNRGRIDLLCVTPSGTLILVETKLWKNPEQHRAVVAQIIDYAKEVATWDYDHLCGVVLTASRAQGESKQVGLEEKVRPYLVEGGSDLTDFQDEMSANLSAGRFLLLIVGDRISENVAFMTKTIQSAPGLHFTLGLVEMKMYRQSGDTEWPLLVVPDIKAKTLEVIRGVVQIQYKQERPTVQVEVEDDDAGTSTSPPIVLDIEQFLASVTKDLKPVYQDGIERWTALGGTLRPSAKVLFWEMELAGEPRKVIRTRPTQTALIRRADFEQWSGNPRLYEEYLQRLDNSATVSQIAHAGKIKVKHAQVTPKDVEVILNAHMWLAEAVRNEEQAAG